MTHSKDGQVTYRIDVLSLGEWAWAPGFEIYWMEPTAPAERLEVVGLLIRGQGRTILVNTGPDLGMLPAMNAAWAQFDPRHIMTVRADQQLVAALGALGVVPSDVDTVVVTPFQPYAIGNLLQLPRAEFAFSKRGWLDFHEGRWPHHPHDHRSFVIPEHVLVPLVTDQWSRVRLLEDEDQIAPGLRSFWTGGHHRGSIALEIPTAEGIVVAGDCFFRRENITENRPLGINESMEETLIAYKRIAGVADILIPLYDPEARTRHPNGIG